MAFEKLIGGLLLAFVMSAVVLSIYMFLSYSIKQKFSGNPEVLIAMEKTDKVVLFVVFSFAPLLGIFTYTR